MTGGGGSGSTTPFQIYRQQQSELNSDLRSTVPPVSGPEPRQSSRTGINGRKGKKAADLWRFADFLQDVCFSQLTEV